MECGWLRLPHFRRVGGPVGLQPQSSHGALSALHAFCMNTSRKAQDSGKFGAVRGKTPFARMRGLATANIRATNDDKKAAYTRWNLHQTYRRQAPSGEKKAIGRILRRLYE